MCTDSRPTAWTRNTTVTITTPTHEGMREDTFDYRMLFAAVALAETSYGVHIAHRAIEQNAVAEGMDLAVAAFGGIHDTHHLVLDPAALELVTRLAFILREGRDWLDAEGNEPATGAAVAS